MKVLLISHMPPPTTGIGSWTRRVLECGIPECEISFVNSNMIGGRDPFQNTRVNIRDEIKRSLSIWKNEAVLLKKEHADVVHTNIPCTLMGMLRESVTALIAKVYGAKFIIHCHCTIPNVVNSGLKKTLFMMLSWLVDGYIVLNTASEDFVRKYTFKKTKIIPNFVCHHEIQKANERVIGNSVKNVLFVGGVSADKGCDTLVLAAKELPNVKFHLVGIVSPEIAEMDIPKNVTLYGNREKEFIHNIMLKSDVFVFLSRYFGEGFSVALVEAMSLGLPCIVTDWAANADMVGRQCEGGLVIPQMDHMALVEAINTLQDQKLRKRMSVRNIDTVEKKYTNLTVTQNISAFYNMVMDK